MKKLILLVSVVGLVAAFGGTSTAVAACTDGSSQQKDANGNATGADTVTGLPDGGTVYGQQPTPSGGQGYIGVTGSHGYIELSGNTSSGPQVDGQSTDGPVSGTVNEGGVKLQGVNC